MQTGGGIATAVTSYVAQAVHFNGSTRLQTSTSVSADTSLGILSFWINGYAGPGGTSLFRSPSGRVFFGSAAGNQFQMILNDSTSTNTFNARSNNVIPSTWTNILMSFAMNHAAGSRIWQLFFDGVQQA